ncbi:Tetratricopeptide repeat-containing protein [Thermomonospora echinospora]|uniref:Tetratricopeptide repeat-containing protein n=1 Tax=Thermomonospora echinospora TaxID=1992 RepID=A0A1H6AE09_9ACTN|nr:tetratricopeptide repeat protein [Thermomonospora echinospora]SEG46404.1 Tetratricopeptide repeat-containing protein [Thermomonospora echinospora]
MKQLDLYEEYRRAVDFFEAKDYAGASRILAPIAEREPGNRAVTELLGRAHFHSASLGRAERAFRRLVELDPADGWAYEALARTLERAGRPDEAGRHRRLARALGAESSAEIEVSVTAADLV